VAGLAGTPDATQNRDEGGTYLPVDDQPTRSATHHEIREEEAGGDERDSDPEAEGPWGWGGRGWGWR
jgi:hypothetical protein